MEEERGTRNLKPETSFGVWDDEPLHKLIWPTF